MSILKQEPAVVVGLVGSILITVGQVLTGDLTWAAAAPIVFGVLTRFLVSPAGGSS